MTAWTRTKGRKGTYYRWQEYGVSPYAARGRGGRVLKQRLYSLTFKGRPLGRPFVVAATAMAFAEAYDALDTPQERSMFLRNGGEWAWDYEQAKRRARDEKRWARYKAEAAARGEEW